jgi:hypothetical protein
MADIPEAEGLFAEGSTDFLKLASSAAHVAGRKYTSAESFITVRFKGTRLTLPEMKLVAGRAYAAGINRLTFHGIPYPYKCVDKREWYPFSGTSLSNVPVSTIDKSKKRILAGPLPMSTQFNEAFLRSKGMSDFVMFLSRLSVAMTAGKPVADVAWLRMKADVKDAADVQIGRNRCGL